MEIKLRLRELREEYGYTQMQIADFLNVRQNTYSQYELGKREIPLIALVKLAGYYQVSLDYIVGRE